MKLSIVIICWNDLTVIKECLRSIYSPPSKIPLEVIVSDNGSTDGSVDFIRRDYPQVRVVENHSNLGFAKGNNAGIRESTGEYVLILNPDTIIHPGSLDRLVAFAQAHPEAGGFGCRVLNSDGSYQGPARPFPTVWRLLIAALYLRPLARLGSVFLSDEYKYWDGETERTIDWQSGCCVMFRRDLLDSLSGFDEQFFYHFEEVDLCLRVWRAGYSIWYTPNATITHLGGQSVGRFPIRFELEKCRSRYRYFYKHYGVSGVRSCRRVTLLWLVTRRVGYGLKACFQPSVQMTRRLRAYGVLLGWNGRIDAVRFAQRGEEPLIHGSDV